MILPDEYSTGSSLMPQKKILTRGNSARENRDALPGHFSALTTLKGLPSGYQRDLQEDKEALFAAHDQVVAMLAWPPERWLLQSSARKDCRGGR